MGLWRMGIGRARTGEGPISRLRRVRRAGPSFRQVVVKDWTGRRKKKKKLHDNVVTVWWQEKGWRGVAARRKRKERGSEWGSSSAAESLVSLHGCKG